MGMPGIAVIVLGLALGARFLGKLPLASCKVTTTFSRTEVSPNSSVISTSKPYLPGFLSVKVTVVALLSLDALGVKLTLPAP